MESLGLFDQSPVFYLVATLLIVIVLVKMVAACRPVILGFMANIVDKTVCSMSNDDYGEIKKFIEKTGKELTINKADCRVVILTKTGEVYLEIYNTDNRKEAKRLKEIKVYSHVTYLENNRNKTETFEQISVAWKFVKEKIDAYN